MAKMQKKRHHASHRSHAGEGEYEGKNGRNRDERRDSMMLSEDHSALANLPQDVKYHPWPKAGQYADYDLDDTIRGIDEQLDADGSGMRKHKGGNKW